MEPAQVSSIDKEVSSYTNKEENIEITTHMVSSPEEENRDVHSLILASTSKSNSRQADDEDQEQLKNLSLHIDISKVFKTF